MLYDLEKHYINAKKGLGKIPCYQANEKDKKILNVITSSQKEINNDLLKYGGILLRGFDIRSASEFSKVANEISPNLLDYVNRSTPRTKLGNKIYTATEYQADRYIPFHNEMSYSLSWPNKLLFLAVIVADEGGQTAIADSRQVYNKIDTKIINKFNDKKVMYTRNYYKNIDLSWQEVFQLSEKSDVEKFCHDNSIQYQWKQGDLELSTNQVCQATLQHPTTSESVWFNQAHLFHISSLDESNRKTLIDLLGKDHLPRNALYGDGSEIEESTLNIIKNAYEEERIEFKWQKGDVMIIDNILMAHSRNPFKGNRKVIVAMGD